MLESATEAQILSIGNWVLVHDVFRLRLALNSDALRGVVVKLVGDLTFTKSRHDEL